MAGRIIGWKEAEEQGLKPLRMLDARVAHHRDGTVFYVEEMVEYEGGDRGWRRLQGVGAIGRPYTERYNSQGEAETAVARILRKLMVSQAVEALTAGDHDFNRMSLERLCEKAGFGSVNELVSAFLSRHSVVEEAMAEIARRGLGKVSDASILMPDFFGGAVTVEALVSGWEAKRTAWDVTVRSRELEARKERDWSERLEREYDFIVRKAMEKAATEGIKALPRETLSIEGVAVTSAARILDLIAEALSAHPYLRHVVTDPSTNARLWVSEDGRSWKEWGGPYEKWERKRQIAKRAKATDAFGEDPAEHWGVVKSRLLRRLKPEVLGILHRQDIQERLDLARAEKDAFVVFGDWGFLWNPERERWEQRDFERPETDGDPGRGSHLWREGRIISSNHGRIIVLPFTKADGTTVDGYTRNAPHQGRSEPRANPVEIPFKVYDDLGRDDIWDHEGSIHVR
jgi:hypothetical protein